MLDIIGTLIGIVISVGAIVVSITTQLNHVKHIRADVDRQSAEVKDLYTRIDSIHDVIGELRADFRSIKSVCDERHKT